MRSGSRRADRPWLTAAQGRRSSAPTGRPHRPGATTEPRPGPRHRDAIPASRREGPVPAPGTRRRPGLSSRAPANTPTPRAPTAEASDLSWVFPQRSSPTPSSSARPNPTTPPTTTAPTKTTAARTSEPACVGSTTSLTVVRVGIESGLSSPTARHRSPVRPHDRPLAPASGRESTKCGRRTASEPINWSFAETLLGLHPDST